MSIKVRHVLRTALVSCVGVALTATALQGPAAAAPQDIKPPAEDPFYTPPSPLPEGRPGDIIRSRPAVFTVDPFGKAPYEGVASWQVLYRSETVHGTPTAVSGIVLVPTKARTGEGRRPLDDQIIPFEQADTLHQAWCAKGANVTWKTYTLAEHATGMVWSWPDAMAFLTDRFAGKPSEGNCAA